MHYHNRIYQLIVLDLTQVIISSPIITHYGSDIRKLVMNEGGNIPKFIVNSIECVENRGIQFDFYHSWTCRDGI